MSATSERYRKQEQKFIVRATKCTPASAPLWLEIAYTYRLLAESEERLEAGGCMIVSTA